MIEMLRPVEAEGMAPPMGHYTDAIVAGKTLYLSGLIATDAAGRLVGRDDVAAQSRQVFQNMGALLAAAGARPGNVAKVTVFMRDIGERAKMNAARKEFFGEHRPASTLVEVSALVLPEVLVEIEAIAFLG